MAVTIAKRPGGASPKRLVDPPTANACMPIYAPAHCPSLNSPVDACNAARRERVSYSGLRCAER
jgi:hypothetical protein